MVDSDLFSRLDISVLVANRLIVSQNWAGGGREYQSDPFSRLYYIKSGQGELDFSYRTIIMNPFHIYSIPAFHECRYVCTKDMDLSYIHYGAHFHGRLNLFDHYRLPLSFSPARPEEAERLFDNVTKSGDNGGFNFPGKVLRREGSMRLLLADLIDKGEPVRDISDLSRFDVVFSFIEENLTDHISLGGLAGLVGLHPTYFSNLFTETMGITPMAYVRRKRVDRASLLLAYSEDKLESIAGRTGFSDAFHLSRVFKELTGVSPRQFRMRVRGEG